MVTRLGNKSYDNHRTTRDAVVRARVSSDLKHDAENILDKLGITISEAISLYLAQIKLNDGIPFTIKVPNKLTLKTFTETDQGKNVVKVKKVQDIFKEAGL